MQATHYAVFWRTIEEWCGFCREFWPDRKGGVRDGYDCCSNCEAQ